MAQDESYTIEEISQMLKVSKLTVYDLAKKGDLIAYRVGRQMRIDEKELAAYKKRSQEGSILSREDRQENIESVRNIVISGQDHSLDIFSRALERVEKGYQPLRSQVGSLDSLIAMYENRADIVSAHLYDGETDSYNIPYVRKLLVSKSFIVIHFISRQAGFYVQKGNPKEIYNWSDLARSDVKLVNREPGAGARVLVDEMLRTHQIAKEQVDGFRNVETSHASVASRIAAGDADVGVGIAQAAESADVDFLPLITESYDLVMLQTEENKKLIDYVQTILANKDFQKELTTLGYDIKNIGDIMYEQ